MSRRPRTQGPSGWREEVVRVAHVDAAACCAWADKRPPTVAVHGFSHSERRYTFMRTTLLKAIGLAMALLSCWPSTFARAADMTSPDTRATAEDGFIYGLPVVMIYNIMYDYAVDRNSGQFKAPFNQIKNETQVYTYKDTAIVTPNSDTPYSWLWMDLRAEPMVLSVPAVPKGRYFSVQLTDLNSFNFGYIGSPKSRPASSRYSGPAASSRWGSIAPSSSTRTTCPTSKRCRRATRSSRCRHSSSDRRLRRPRRSISRRSTSSW